MTNADIKGLLGTLALAASGVSWAAGVPLFIAPEIPADPTPDPVIEARPDDTPAIRERRLMVI